MVDQVLTGDPRETRKLLPDPRLMSGAGAGVAFQQQRELGEQLIRQAAQAPGAMLPDGQVSPFAAQGRVPPAYPIKEQPPEFSLGQMWADAFDRESIAGSILSDETLRGSRELEEGFDLIAWVKENDMWEHVETFINKNAFNRDMAMRVKAHIERQQEMDRRAAEAPLTSMTLSTVAALADPVTLPLLLVPGAMLIRGGIGTVRSGATAAKIAALAASEAAVAEGVLHLTQTERTLDETVYAISGSALLGALIGGAGARFLSKAELETYGSELGVAINRSPIALTAVARAQNLIGRSLREGEDPVRALELSMEEVQDPIARAVNKHIVKRLRLSPTGVLATSSSPTARAFMRRLADHLQTTGEAVGKTDGPSAEALRKGHQGQWGSLVSDLRDTRSQAVQSGARINYDYWKRWVGEAMRYGDNVPDHVKAEMQASKYANAGKTELDSVTRGAKRSREFFDDMFDRAIEAGVLKREDFPEGAPRDYLHRMFRDDKVTARADDFRFLIESWFRGGRSGATQKGPPVSGDEAKDISRAVFNRITGNPSVENLNLPPWLIADARGGARARTLSMPDNYEAVRTMPDGSSKTVRLSDFLENDIEVITGRYATVMGAEIALHKTFGSADLKVPLKQVEDEFAERITAASSVKEANRLQAERDRVLTNLGALRDRLRGTRNAPYEAGRVAAVNRMALTVMGMMRLPGVMISSLPDVATAIGRYGVAATLKPIIPAMRRMLREAAPFTGRAFSKYDYQLGGTAMERLNNHRIMGMMDLIEHNQTIGKAERAANKASQLFFTFTGLPHWTDAGKHYHGILATERVLSIAEALGRGREVKEVDLGWISNLGIRKSDAEDIVALMNAGVIRRDKDGLWEPRSGDWMDALDTIRGTQTREAIRADFKKRIKKAKAEDKDALRKARDDALVQERASRRDVMDNFRAALATEVDRGIVTPGIGDKPLIAEHPVSRHALQFKSFLLAANNRLLLSGLQGRKLWLAEHLVFGTMIGMFVAYYKLAERKGKKEADKLFDNTGEWLVQGLDRSGTMAVLFEANNIVDKYVSSGLSLQAVGGYLAGDEGDMQGQASRFANRNLGDLAGPIAGWMQDVLTVTGTLQQVYAPLPHQKERELRESDLNAFWRSLNPAAPVMNHPGLKWATPAIKEQVRETLGVEAR